MEKDKREKRMGKERNISVSRRGGTAVSERRWYEGRINLPIKKGMKRRIKRKGIKGLWNGRERRMRMEEARRRMKVKKRAGRRLRQTDRQTDGGVYFPGCARG